MNDSTITSTAAHRGGHRTGLRRAALVAGIVVALAACGGSDADTSAPAATDAPAAAAEPTPTGGIVATGSTDLGDILTTANGLSLYGFTPDAGGTPTCNDGCAAAWPPLVVDGADLPDGLDASIFSVVQRDDGSYQLAANDWPLYRFASDIVAGDITGQESGGNWFLAAPDGTLIGAPGAEGIVTDDEEAAGGYGY